MKRACLFWLLKIFILFALIFGVNIIYTQEKGLVAYWSFDEENGKVAKDISGNRNDGEIFDVERVEMGIKGRALKFKGEKESYVNCGNSKILNFDRGSFSYSCWVYVIESIGKYDMPIFKGGSNRMEPGYDIELGKDEWVANISDGIQVKQVGLGYEENNKWVYLAVVIDREKNKMFGYRDGNLISFVDIKGFGSVSSEKSLWLSHPAYPFKGLIDEVKIYNRALEPEEIKKNFFEEKEKIIYYCYPMKKEPLMDGKIKGDPAWDNIPYGIGFYRLGTGYPSLKQTKIKVGFREKFLYFGVECEEPEIRKIFSMGKDGDPLWMEDSIEIFFVPPKKEECIQFIVNTEGARTTVIYKDGLEKKVKMEGWKAAVFKGEDYYSIEVAIPFTLLNYIPNEGDVGKFTVCRNILTTPEERYTSFTQANLRFYEPENFAQIIFKSEQLEDLKDVQKIEKEINKKYGSILIIEIEKLLNFFGQFEKISGFSVGGKEALFSKELTSIRESVAKITSELDYSSPIDVLYLKFSELNKLKEKVEKMGSFFPGLYGGRIINIESVEQLNEISKGRPGDIFVFAPGVYTCSKLIIPDGIEGHYITIRSRGDGKVILENDGTTHIIISGSFNIFDGIELRMNSDKPKGYGFFIDNKKNVIIQNCRTSNCQTGIYIRYSQNIKIENCEISHSGHFGVWCFGSGGTGLNSRYNPDAKNMNITIRNCYLHDAGWNSDSKGGFTTEGYGIAANGAIENLIIEHCQIDNNSGDGILFEDWSRNTIVRYNVIRGSGIAGIWVDNAEMCTIENNYIESNNVAIWLSGEDTSNRFLTNFVSIRNNIIVHNDYSKFFDPLTGMKPPYGKRTIIISSNTRNVYFDNNTIAFNKNPVLFELQRRPRRNVYSQDNYRDIWFRNNIFWKNSGSIQESLWIRYSYDEDAHQYKELNEKEVHFINNLWDIPYKGDPNPITGEPLFVDPDSSLPEGFRIRDKSAAIDKAMVFDGACDIHIDAWNGLRPLHGFGTQDIGAHEYGTNGKGFIGLNTKAFPFSIPSLFKVKFNSGPEKW